MRKPRETDLTLFGIEVLIVVALIAAIVMSLRVMVAHGQEGPRATFTDKNGKYQGSAFDNGRSTTFTDRDGKFSGTSIRNNDGSTSLYDRNGHFTGSVTREGVRK